MNEILPQTPPMRNALDMIVGASVPTKIVLAVLALLWQTFFAGTN